MFPGPETQAAEGASALAADPERSLMVDEKPVHDVGGQAAWVGAILRP